MKLVEAAQAPFVLDVEFKPSKEGDKPRQVKVAIPFMELGDFVKWGQLIDSGFNNEITKGMTQDQKLQVLMFYGPMPSNLNKLKSMARAPEGVRYIIKTQLDKSMVIEENGEPTTRELTDDEKKRIKKFRLVHLRELADQLADIGQTEAEKLEAANAKKKTNQSTQPEGGQDDPLSSSDDFEQKD
jgi:hypothetical protein